MNERVSDTGAEMQPHGVGILFPKIKLLRDMTLSDLQAMVDDVMQTIEIPSWIESDSIVTRVFLNDPETAQIRIVLPTFLRDDGQNGLNNAVAAFKDIFGSAMAERNRQWNAEHPDL